MDLGAAGQRAVKAHWSPGSVVTATKLQGEGALKVVGGAWLRSRVGLAAQAEILALL